MNEWSDQLPILPVAVPLMAGAAMLLVRESHRRWLGMASVLIQMAAAIALLRLAGSTDAGSWSDGVGVYLLGDWPASIGIVLVVDRLTAIMLALSALLAAATLFYSMARWDRAGVHFHPLFQFLMMGLNGAFLTGDLFNLFVFFEVLLAASYGLLLHGSGTARVGAGVHYIVVNLLASFMLLIAIALVYGTTGTLNMADVALQAGKLSGHDRMLFESAAAILGIGFLIKAAAWPLNFWLPNAYSAACAPVAAVFAITTKVGIYALLRLGSLLLPSGAPAAFGGDWMFPIGLATLAFGSLGLLAAQQTQRVGGYCIIISSGTLLTALGMPGVALTGPALFYLISSVLGLGAFFLLAEVIERTRPFGANLLAVSLEAFNLEDPDLPDLTDDIAGMPIPAAIAFLGLAFFTCALLITGLPPLSGFVAKFALLSAALPTSGSSALSDDAWLLVAAVLLSGMAAIIALARSGIRMFWSSEERLAPNLRLTEAAPVAVLLTACVALVVWAGPIMTYLDATAQSLDQPATYINAVLQQPPARPLNWSAS